MDEAITGITLAKFGVPQAQDEGDTMRHGLKIRAQRHAQTRELMQLMVQRHAMHRRMMHQAMRHAIDD